MKPSRISLPVAILGCGILLQAGVVFCYSVTRVYMLGASAFDIGVDMQVLHAINAYGAPLSTLLPLPGEQHLLGIHFMPFYYALAPLYALFPSFVFLEAVHAVALSLASIPIYLAARALGLERKGACVAALAYLFNPFTLGAGVFGFMDYSLAAPWMAIALLGLAARRFGLVVLGAILLLLNKENYGVSVMMMGLLWWKLYDDKRRGLMLGIAGLVAALLVMLVIMPYFRGDYVHPMLAADGASRYGWVLLPKMWDIVLPPLMKGDLIYITLLLVMFGFLPLAGAWWLLPAVGSFAVTLLSADPAVRGLFDSHSLPLTPVLAVAACAGYMRLRPLLRSRLLVVGMAGFVGLAYVYFAALPLPLSLNQAELPARPRFVLSPADARAVSAINTLVPPDAALAVQFNIGMFFNRRYLYVFPGKLPPVDDVVAYLDSPWKNSPMMNCSDFGVYAQWVKDMLNDPSLKIIYWQKPWLLMSRQGEDMSGAHGQAKEALGQFINRQYQLCKLWSGL